VVDARYRGEYLSDVLTPWAAQPIIDRVTKSNP
jgi:hypothetical protein